ncbi:MAG: ATP-binding protein [Acidimicrobiales bacterium]
MSIVEAPPDPALRHLLGRLEVVHARVRAAVDRHRVPDPDGDERFRGLYISDAEVDALLLSQAPPAALPSPDSRLLHAVEAAADAAEGGGADIRLRRLARSFGLNPVDVELLLVALAPDLDPRLERVYAYLHDDVSRRRASTGLALELCGTWMGPQGRARLEVDAPLLLGGLIVIEEDDRPFLTRPLRVPDRVAAHLLGHEATDPVVAALLTPCSAAVDSAVELQRAVTDGCRLVYIREPSGGAGFSMAGRALADVGIGCLSVDLSRLGRDEDVRTVADRLTREALLIGAGLVAGPVEALAERSTEAVRCVAESRCLVVLIGARAWDPQWSREVPFVTHASALDHAGRRRAWESALRGIDIEGSPVDATTQFHLTPEQIGRAATSARRQAAAAGRPVVADDLRSGSRAQNAAGLERLARRVAPRAGWDDLVLPPVVVDQLRDVVSRVRHRERVLDEWGMGRRSSKGRGVKALFAGDSGTGKTMSAEVAAAELGLDLYVIDLSTVVDKYVGETEKNLDRIFAEADRINGVLLFDEADALFGKRSEVKDAQDRYANVEVAYLLQRMESFDGLAILTTNLRANLDEAFARRLDAIVDFPMPEEDDRRRLWELNLAMGVPLSGDLDLGFMATRFKISGGSIRNIVLSAAFAAAAEDHPVHMVDLIRGTEREYRKLGHLLVESEFGPYHRGGA